MQSLPYKGLKYQANNNNCVRKTFQAGPVPLCSNYPEDGGNF